VLSIEEAEVFKEEAEEFVEMNNTRVSWNCLDY
jgi:hypothetical protein